ncbi:MAG: hypothetical protein N2170_01415 [Bacteroidia bacterium]|nr:hypothetical protein [Bacteroidia bacterium]
MTLESTNRWESLTAKVSAKYGGEPSEESLLFLIGLHEWGDYPPGEEKRVKADLIQLGVLVLLERAGFMRRTGVDAEGWPTWERTQPIPSWSPGEQRRFLREAIIDYFAEIWEL